MKTKIGNEAAIIEFEANFKTAVPSITIAEWNAKHRDYKTISSGVNADKGIPAGIPAVMGYDNGTFLQYVRVI
jgi:hypothetical protein